MSVSDSRGVSGKCHVSDENRTDEGLLKVHGVALGDNDITIGSTSNEKKLWRPEVLSESASYLEGRDIVVNHENHDAYKKVGEVKEVQHQKGKGIVYQGVIMDDELEDKVELGWLDVSPKVIHSEDHDNVNGVKSPNKILDFPNLSIVRRGASPSNELRAGEHPSMSVEELQSCFKTDEVQEYHFNCSEELENGLDDFDFAQWLFETPEAAIGAAQAFPCSGVHEHTVEGKTWYMPCSSHEKFLQSVEEANSEELAKFGEDEFVTWDDGNAHGKIVDWTDDGVYDASIDGDVSVEGTSDDPAALIQIHKEVDGGWKAEDTMVAHKFSTLNKWEPSSIVEENISEEEMQLSQARTPDYDETETTSWADVSKTLENFLSGVSGDTDDVNSVGDLTNDQKTELASHTLLGNPNGTTFREVVFFPVVNPNTGDLNKGALEAVRGGRGHSADISDSAFSSAFEKAGRLLNKEFSSEVEVEMSASSYTSAVVSVELDVNQEDLDEVYSDWSEEVNMTESELREWSGNPCSREASLDSEAVIERNLRLLETPKSEWSEEDIKDAERTVSFISRMRPNEPDSPRDGPFGCPSEWAISLLNWAYNPFDTVPDVPDNEELDDVEELEMAKHKNEMSQEEQRMASMLSSHSSMTKEEAMGMISSVNPNRETDVASLAKATSVALGAHKEEMQKLMERMRKHEDEMNSKETRDVMQRHVSEEESTLNKIVN